MQAKIVQRHGQGVVEGRSQCCQTAQSLKRTIEEPRELKLSQRYYPFGAGIIFLILAHLYIQCE